MHDPKGSLWRRWDLHFHTPSSYDYKDMGIQNQQIIDSLVAAQIRVVAITDHCTINVPRIRALQELGRGKIIVLPGIELCSELGGKTPVHFIGIFHEDCNLEYIWGDLEVKLNLRKEDIERRGGYQNIYTDLKEAAALIHEHAGLVSIHAGTKSNTVEALSSNYLTKQAQKTDLLKTHVDILEVGKPQDLVDYETKVFPQIQEWLPVVICSDNHRATEYRTKAACWLKADPSFYGLLHALVEPRDSFFIGEVPEKRKIVASNKTKYIRSVRIQKDENSLPDETWFDATELALNHDLVAIIGNKGSGKSALAEVLGLLGNTRGEKSFSFLSEERFRMPKNNRARHFTATLEWESGPPNHTSLDQMVDETFPERVKCIPQGMFEDVCNDIATGVRSKFQKELKKVIFSHVPSAQRLGQSSLDDLISHLTEETYQRIEILKKRLHTTNERILDIEVKLTPEYRKELENLLESKQAELASLEEIRPTEVPEPDTQAQQGMSELAQAIAAAEQRREKLRKKRTRAEKKQENAAILVSLADRVLQQVENFTESFRLFKEDCSKELKHLGLEFDMIAQLSIETRPLTSVRDRAETARLNAKKLLDPSTPESLVSQIEAEDDEIERLQRKLDEPSQKYAQYVSDLKRWEDQCQEVVGRPQDADTISYYTAQLEQLNTLPGELDALKKSHWELVKQIYEQIEKLAKAYRGLYTPVQQITEKYEFAKKAFNLEFDVSVIDVGLGERLFDWIGRHKAGSFHGPDGEKRLKSLIDKHDLNTWPGVETFLNDLLDHLTKDKRDTVEPPVRIADQLKSGQDAVSLYDYIFSLDYLRPHYILKLDGKELEQLSPGERGALLLIFYLLIDKDDIPLIIDQPEENLDNQTVYQMLVDAIKEAKKRRQIIVVTHSPNLAVVCNAEQIICCSIDKQQGNRITYMSGAIENPLINRKIVDILEGTKPALSNRWAKYAPFHGEIS